MDRDSQFTKWEHNSDVSINFINQDDEVLKIQLQIFQNQNRVTEKKKWYFVFSYVYYLARSVNSRRDFFYILTSSTSLSGLCHMEFILLKKQYNFVEHYMDKEYIILSMRPRVTHNYVQTHFGQLYSVFKGEISAF